MSSGSSLTSKLYDKIIKMLSKSHETIPLICWKGKWTIERKVMATVYLWVESVYHCLTRIELSKLLEGQMDDRNRKVLAYACRLVLFTILRVK
jgi:hypothetical protein